MATLIPHPIILQASAMIEQRLGIAVHTQFRGALDEILLSLSGGDVANYIQRLENCRETDETWQNLVDALTIGETYFLRDKTHFDLLRNQVLPEIIERHRKAGQLNINIWSVGCSTGEEPYSMGITLYELLPDIDRWTIHLLGTDVNGRALHAARRGVYRKWAFRHTDFDFQSRYFDPAPEGLQIKPIIRQRVTFQHANLFTPSVRPLFDLILCRHVLLYFNDEHTRRAELLLYSALAPGGWLLLGQSETVHGSAHLWTMNRYPIAPIYQKPATSVGQRPASYNRQLNAKKTTSELNALMLVTYQEAVAAIQHEEHEAAEALAQDLLSFDPKYPLAHVLLAGIEANRQNALAAHNRLDTALELNPLLADGYYLRALLFMEENDTNSARKALNAALYCRRYHPLALFMLGNVHAQTGELKRAMRYWETTRRAIAHLSPEDPVSDISPITAGQLTSMAGQHLED